jgi:hypothetical protein
MEIERASGSLTPAVMAVIMATLEIEDLQGIE